jgi:signal transduction histidine kinase
MARLELATSGKSLGLAEGVAGLSGPSLRYIVRRGALTAVSIGALIAGVAATTTAIGGHAYAGVEPDNPGSLVIAVDPTGYAWPAGIRAGQIILELGASDDPGGWFITTKGAVGTFTARAASVDAGLTESWFVGLAAILLAYLSVLFLRTRRRWVLPAAATGLLAASIPLGIYGGPDTAILVLGAAALVPAGSLAIRLPGPRPIAILAAVLVVGVVLTWAIARLTGWQDAAELESVRGSLAIWGTGILFVERVALPGLAREPIPVMRPRLFDVAAIALVAAVGVALVNLAHVHIAIVAILLVAVLMILPMTRQGVGGSLESALLGDLREAAAAEAAEQERARLARELHDVPLQELVGVIRRLEVIPGAEAASESLRAVAGHLRNVATELRPPVLDDLGLPAALDYLAEETTTAALPVRAEVVDDTGFGAEHRPPADVELAMYRIAAEAVENAIRHSGGTTVALRATVAPDRIELSIADDGAGLRDGAGRDAAKRKRLGLASMRRRAQAIDAELSIDGSRGTRVRVMWQA